MIVAKLETVTAPLKFARNQWGQLMIVDSTATVLPILGTSRNAIPLVVSFNRLAKQRDRLLGACVDVLDVYDLLTDNGYAYRRPIVFGKDLIAHLRTAVKGGA